MKKNLSNQEMKNIFGGDWSQRYIGWDYSGGGGGLPGNPLGREGVGHLLQWFFSWFN